MIEIPPAAMEAAIAAIKERCAQDDGAWWKCPNDPPCPHGGAVHDVYDLEDEVPTCCVEGCRCGHRPPGTRPGPLTREQYARLLRLAPWCDCHDPLVFGHTYRCWLTRGGEITSEGDAKR